MKIAIALVLALSACAHAGVVPLAPHLVRVPSLDSAVIQSDRLGGNFAYSTKEAHAYAAISPVVQNVVSPVAVSYSSHQVATGPAVPVAYAHQPVAFAPQHIAYAPQPIAYAQQPIAYAQQPIAYAQQPIAYAQQPIAYVPQTVVAPQAISIAHHQIAPQAIGVVQTPIQPITLEQPSLTLIGQNLPAEAAPAEATPVEEAAPVEEDASAETAVAPEAIEEAGENVADDSVAVNSE